MNIREIALKLLLDYEECGKYVNLSLSSHITDNLSREEMGRLTGMLYTTVEGKIRYDYYIAALAARPVEKFSAHTLAILRLGMAQIFDMERIPDFAAVNETVKLTKNKGERALVNAILRKAAECKDNPPMPDKNKNAPRYYSVKYSIPLKTVKHLIGELSESGAVEFFEKINGITHTTLTVNTQRISVDDLISILKEDGYNVTRATFSDFSVYVNGSFDVRRAKGYEEGYFFVQDEASAISVQVLGARAGDVIIDVCSAPGGKALAASVFSGGESVMAFDLHESKISLINNAAKRLGLPVNATARDALSPDESLFGKADKVICDAPCSGLGVMAKKPDLRYKDISVAAELPELQYNILTSSSRYLKSGGAMVYSTCTLNRCENEEVVHRFLEANSDFYVEDFKVGSLESKGGMLTLYPHVHNTDGFFVARLRKK